MSDSKNRPLTQAPLLLLVERELRLAPNLWEELHMEDGVWVSVDRSALTLAWLIFNY